VRIYIGDGQFVQRRHAMFDSLLGKGEEVLEKEMSDPQKVAEAKQKADGLLEKHMDQQQAEEITNVAEEALQKFTDQSQGK
jgi:hypothetical protein